METLFIIFFKNGIKCPYAVKVWWCQNSYLELFNSSQSIGIYVLLPPFCIHLCWQKCSNISWFVYSSMHLSNQHLYKFSCVDRYYSFFKRLNDKNNDISPKKNLFFFLLLNISSTTHHYMHRCIITHLSNWQLFEFICVGKSV